MVNTHTRKHPFYHMCTHLQELFAYQSSTSTISDQLQRWRRFRLMHKIDTILFASIKIRQITSSHYTQTLHDPPSFSSQPICALIHKAWLPWRELLQFQLNKDYYSISYLSFNLSSPKKCIWMHPLPWCFFFFWKTNIWLFFIF